MNVAKSEDVDALLATPQLADALESDRFKRFLDLVPLAIIVSAIQPCERIIYANPEFEKLTGQSAADIVGKQWAALCCLYEDASNDGGLGAAIQGSTDCVGTFRIRRSEREPAIVDAHSNLIQDDDGRAAFRLAALVDVGAYGPAERQELEQKIRDKDVLLREIQHRVKNNLQLITALIRIETRNARGQFDKAPFHRLAGRIESVQLVYKLLSAHGQEDEIDLGVYLSEIASGVMHSHAVNGIRLDLKVDAFPVSVNVAMPTGLVVNELLTNAFKYAFEGRDGGTITLHSLVDGNGCRVIIADDGVGLPSGIEWPKTGKLSALIVQSLRENAKAELKVESSPGNGTRVTIAFTRKASAPEVMNPASEA
jgi:PAS domain S-box-containing protein